MIDSDSNTTADFAVALLIYYSFDLGVYTAGELINRWLNDYPANWLRLAVIEALYQGRYKAISVEQILAFWKRRGDSLYHFNHEFERLICGDIPQTFNGQADTIAKPSPPVPESVVRFSNEHDGTLVTTEEGAGEKTRVKVVDATANIPPLTNQIGKEQRRYHQTTDNDKKSRSLNSDHSRIEQFTPDKADGSDFYTKLKAIASKPQD